MSEEFELSEWEQPPLKKFISFAFGYLLVFFFIGQFNT